MQYLHNMFTGLPKLAPLDNDRYPDIRWTKVSEMLAAKKVMRACRPLGDFQPITALR